MEDHFENIWYLRDQNERIKLIEELEKKILAKRKTMRMNSNSDLLYQEAKSSFIIGNFISAAITFYLATEQYLLWKNQARKRQTLETLEYPESNEIFQKALKNNFINEKLKRDLELYTEGCRNQIMHPKSINHLQIVGLRKTSRKSTSFGRKGDPAVYLGPLGCAKRALNLFFEIFEFNC